ncbi:MAG: FecR domain-containing protein [Xanthobacteraceae bacterium]|nr:FecR domain-containing protein [Xanthobacteraceae bacterium]
MAGRWQSLVWSAVALLALVPGAGRAAENWGKVGAVNHEATGTRPGEGPHALMIGAGVIHGEAIKTSAQGSTQLVFPDQSTLNVGRNSTLVIDEFVYDPNARSGNMVATLGHGALRFVGGQISHTTGVTIQTEIGTLGIRGGVASIVFPVPARLAAADPALAGCHGELVVADVGTATLQNSVGSVTLRPGFAACANGPDVPIGAPFRISDAALAIIVATLTSSPGQTGGATTPPAGPYVTFNGVGTVILDDPAHPPGADSLGLNGVVIFGNALAGSSSQTNQVTNGVQLPPPPPPPVPPPPGGPPLTFNPPTLN